MLVVADVEDNGGILFDVANDDIMFVIFEASKPMAATFRMRSTTFASNEAPVDWLILIVEFVWLSSVLYLSKIFESFCLVCWTDSEKVSSAVSRQSFLLVVYGRKRFGFETMEIITFDNNTELRMKKKRFSDFGMECDSTITFCWLRGEPIPDGQQLFRIVQRKEFSSEIAIDYVREEIFR